jgi:Domain of unknown function (DUF4442)
VDVTRIPFNELVGIRRAQNDPPFLLELDDLPSYTNHVGTVHVGAQLTLAEASSAECLLRTFKDDSSAVVAVVRRIQAKFKKPLKGKAFSRAKILEGDAQKLSAVLDSKGRGLISVSVDIVDADEVVAMSADIEWFVQKQKQT